MLVKHLGKVLCCIMFFTSSQISFSQITIDSDCNAVHNIGKLVLKSNSTTYFGGKIDEFEYLLNSKVDCITGKKVFDYGAEYPKGSGISLLRYGLVSIAGILNKDTLLAVGSRSIQTLLEYHSITDPNNANYENAISEQDYISVSVDNSTNSYYTPSDYKPLNIQITKKSYAWSYEYTEDFILFDIEIKNVGNQTIKDTYIGIGLALAVGYSSGSNIFDNDDLGGFHQSKQSLQSCNNIINSLDIMWGADNDGDPIDSVYTDKLTMVDSEGTKSATSVSGVFFLDNFSEIFNQKIINSYNWKITSFEPILKKNSNRATRGTNSKEEVYLRFSNGEIDYDPAFTASISQLDEDWEYPNQDYSKAISYGFPNVSHTLSVGPFDLPPGGVLKVPYAYVAGENFHTKPTNIDFLPDFPESYYGNLDFTDLISNAQWAMWIYDNPGVDTDGDGNSGLYTICVLDSQLVDNQWTVVAADTFWYRGDGVPDWKAAGPPPSPYLWLEPTLNGIRVRFNGFRSETEKDTFTRIADFEGYNIYIGRDERETSLSLLASYDKENYDKFIYNENSNMYIVSDIPMTLPEIRCAYAISCDDDFFHPLDHGRLSPIRFSDSLIFFRKHSFNSEQSAITKIYPTNRDPRDVHIDSLVDDDYTDDGYFKFFEYEFSINNLLPTVAYWVNVTAFDFGSPKSGLRALESAKTNQIQTTYPLSNADYSPVTRKQIYVYPNPYRIDAGYRDLGYEGRNEDDRPDYRVRELHFANLPHKCEIKIFSLDGDLIRHLSHDIPNSDLNQSHHRWDLITRNTQMIVSGLYYWTVEFPDGDVQMGKLVVIM